jgi:hypothetical protein
MTPFQKEVYFYGLREKVKATLPPISVAERADKIKAELEGFDNEVFTVRFAETVGDLDSFLIAFAMVAATGQVTTPVGKFEIPASALPLDELMPAWSDLTAPATVKAVKDFWKALPREKKSNLRRNTFILTQESLL